MKQLLLSVFVIVCAGCAMRQFPGSLVTVTMSENRSTSVGGKRDEIVPEEEAVRLLPAEDNALLTAIRKTELDFGFRAIFWHVEGGTIHYQSFRQGGETPPMWIRVDWNKHAIEIFSVNKTDKLQDVVARLSANVREQCRGASVTAVDSVALVRPSLFGP